MPKILEVASVVVLCCVAGGLAACGGGTAEPSASSQEQAAKIPITSPSQEAIELYRQGRDLADKLHLPDARALYAQAVAIDEGFALAHLGMANTSTNAQEFFDGLDRAANAAEGVSEGERWLILAAQAGANSDPAGQKDHLMKLLDAYPGDERAHNQMANWHNGQQETEEAIAHFDKAIEIAPEFSAPYNSLGYAHRALGNYDQAEAAFKKYTEVLPEEPNPYDSYGELLMKMGRYQDSIDTYGKALEKDPAFIASLVGIGNNQMFMGESDQARKTFKGLTEIAGSDGQRRTALFWTAASHLHDGDSGKAVEVLTERYEIAAESGGPVTMSGDLNLIGNVLVHAGDVDAAAAKYAASVELIEQAEVSQDVKEATRRNHLYDQARVALSRGDLDAAATKIDDYREAAEAKQIRFEIRRVHELAGMLALHRSDADAALTELSQANQQDPRVLYLQAMACERKGDTDGLMSFATKAAAFNGLNFNYAFVKANAEKLIESATSPAA